MSTERMLESPPCLPHSAATARRRSIDAIEWRQPDALDDGRIRLTDALVYLNGEIDGRHGDNCATVAFASRGHLLIFCELVRARGGFLGEPWDLPRPLRPFRVVIDVDADFLAPR